MWCVGDRVRWVGTDNLNGLCGTIIGLNGKKTIEIHWDTDVCHKFVGYRSYNSKIQLASYADFQEKIKERLGK